MVMKMNSSCRNNNSSWVLLLLPIAFGLVFMNPTEATKQIIDITHTFHNDMPIWDNKTGSGAFITEKRGAKFQTGSFTLETHYGTHVDSPQHLVDLIPTNPINDTNLDLQTLIGQVLVVRVPVGVRNITAEVISNLRLPIGLERVIFKTDNTDRRLMNQREFVADYTGLTPDGAEWLVNNTNIKFIGVDYMSVAAYAFPYPVHEILLNQTGIIPVECLNLELAEPGYYDVYCLPLKLNAEAAPVRCILMK